MGRGAAQQENLLNTQAGTQFNNAQSLYGGVNTADQAIVANPGYTDQQKTAMTTGTLTPIAQQTAAAQNRMSNTAARTRNDAGLISGEAAAARSGAQAEATAGNQLQTQFANNSQQQQNTALNRQAGLYGPIVGSANSLYGQATQAMAQRKDPLSFGFSPSQGLSING